MSRTSILTIGGIRESIVKTFGGRPSRWFGFVLLLGSLLIDESLGLSRVLLSNRFLRARL